MNIAFFESKPNEKELIAQQLSGHNLTFYAEPLTEQILQELHTDEINIIATFIKSRITKKVIDNLPNLKAIITSSTGYDHIDVAHATSKRITVQNIPSYGSQTVAEFTFALILTLSRNIFTAYHQIREQGNFNISALQGFDLYQKTLGVIGTGKIGRHVITIAKGFGMNIIATDATPDDQYADEQGITYTSLKNLLSTSDIITLHLPLTPDTRHIINANNISRIKTGAILINTARGGLIETSALVTALKNNQLTGAGLDVLESEQFLDNPEELALISGPEYIHDIKNLLQNHTLIDLPNAIITPHIAFFTKEATAQILMTTIQNIQTSISGSPQNLVT